MDYGQKNQIEQMENERLRVLQGDFSGAQAIFSTEANKSEADKESEQAERGEGARNAAMVALNEIQNGQEFDIIGDGQVSEMEAKIASDAVMENVSQFKNVIRFKDARQEAIDEKAAEEIEEIIGECGDNVVELQTKVDDARWTFLKNAFGRDRGEGLGGSKISGVAA